MYNLGESVMGKVWLGAGVLLAGAGCTLWLFYGLICGVVSPIAHRGLERLTGLYGVCS